MTQIASAASSSMLTSREAGRGFHRTVKCRTQIGCLGREALARYLDFGKQLALKSIF
jgi:hypothetical protein